MTPIEIARFWGRVSVSSDFQCWEWRGRTNSYGYGKHLLGMAHRIAYELINGKIPEGMLIRHRCDNKLCCNPRHLEIGTHNDNMADAVERSRMARGLNHPNAKLSPDQVAYIRENPHRLKQSHLAALFGVTPSTISYVKNHKRRIYERSE